LDGNHLLKLHPDSFILDEGEKGMTPKPILLLDDSIQIEISFSREDSDLEDNICLVICESCPDDEKVFKHEESHLFITRQQAYDLIVALTDALQESEEKSN
jgi:hypothetical protein